MDADRDISLLCHRCGADLTPGKGDFYVVRITAVADPTPPHIDQVDLGVDVETEIQSLLDEMEGQTAQQLTDQVYRRMTIHLCADCYAAWIEDPTG